MTDKLSIKHEPVNVEPGEITADLKDLIALRDFDIGFDTYDTTPKSLSQHDLINILGIASHV